MTLPPPGPAEEPEGGPRRRSLRQRLLLALAGISAGSVLLAGLITVALARQATRSAAQDDLRRGLAQVAEADAAGEQIPPLARIQRVMQASGIGLVLVTEVGGVVPPATGPLGRRLPGPPFDRRNTDLDRLREAAVPGARGRLPRGVTSGDLDLGRLLAGQVQEGSSGSLVFVAQPLSPKNSGVPVVVATRRVGIFPVQRLGTVLLLAALASAAVAAGFSVWLVRRLTRPLAAMERTARRIAGGDLQARVEGMAGADDELARLGEAIDSMAAELERAQGLERGFLMSVSHDLRTPLTSIRGYAEAIAEGAADDDEARRRAATIIGAEARRLERLVADLLDLARLDAREFSLHPRPIDAAEVVTTAVDALQPAARETGLALSASAPAGRLPAEVDPERLGQVVANLVENALKYATTAVEVEVRPAGTDVAVAVTDDGAGIDAADLPRVFERLYTARSQGGRKVGTGLGLAIVRELTAAMGGSVEVSRTAEGRTRFLVRVAGRPSGSSTWTSGASSSSPSPPAAGDGSSTSTTTTPAEPSWSSRPGRDTTER